MLTAPTLDKLHALKLAAMAAAWTEQQHHADLTALAFDERFGLLVEAEWHARENKRLTRALQEAKLKLAHACLEAIDYPARRELDKAVMRQLATCRWVEEHHNVILVGATGVGKSFIACALAHQACRKGYRAATAAPRGSSTSSPWPGPTAATSACSGSWPAWTSSSSMTGGSPPSKIRSGATSWRSSRIATACARPSSPASCHPRSGTTTSATPPWPTRSVTASCTMPIALC